MSNSEANWQYEATTAAVIYMTLSPLNAQF